MGKGILSTEDRCTKTYKNKAWTFLLENSGGQRGQIWEGYFPELSPLGDVRR